MSDAKSNMDSLVLNDFAPLGLLATAGLEATRLAIERAATSHSEGRIPIAGAAVTRLPSGELKVVTVGNNGRIPPAGSEGCGYPTDHGETGAVRIIDDLSAVDWASTVFATTLSPCIMCTRTLEVLHAKGLRSIVIAESKSFQGAENLLDALPGLCIVRLTHAAALMRMKAFARRYPWDWAADIGAVPPRHDVHERILALARAEGQKWCADLQEGEASVIAPDGKTLSVAGDNRGGTGGNPCHAAAVCAMGNAGSTVNLRECAVVWKPGGLANLDTFGMTSLGACELFKPAVLVIGKSVESCLASPLQASGVQIVVVGASERSRSRSPRR